VMKRFTETEKWRDPWFRKLPHTLKLGYLYLLDAVDNAGVWDPDFDQADFAIGAGVNWPELMAALGDRLVVLPNGKWHLAKFVEYQYGELSEGCKPHAQVLRLMARHGIKQRVSKGYPKGIHTHKDKDKDKDREKDALEIYEIYPLKVGRPEAIKAILNAFQKAEPAALLEATAAYAKATTLWPEDEKKYIPHASTWFNQERYADDRSNWIKSSPAQSNQGPRVRQVSLL
jgi:hypothetical protein